MMSNIYIFCFLQMCIRMNIVSSLMSYSDIFFKKLASAFNYEWSHVSPAGTLNIYILKKFIGV